MTFLRSLISFQKPGGGDIETIRDILVTLSNWLLFLSMTAAIMVILIGAYHYIFSFGNAERAGKGKTIIYWAVIGLVVIILAKIIIAFALNFVGAKPTVPSPSEVPLFEAPPARPTN